MKYLIREMTIEDIPEVIKGEEEIFKETLGYDMFYSELKLNPYAHYLVLEIDKLVAGYIGFWIEGETASFINFYVLEAYQNLGFGNMLLDFVVELCEMSNVDLLTLEVRVSNQKAIALYEKRGFRISHTRKNYYKDGEDAYVMLKKIKEKQC
ncbi:MAG: ribosomal protein S18-alanine N-acetyltransferase [Bacilli bacterium]|nr:ribosomal protein S18-alanine N-acetyltransferase [Bacilli bacterium]